jgi:ubiquinone/menaquinone biosynthesis C-methylase UbiE
MREGFKSIFKKFSKKDVDEAHTLLEKRWKINKLDINILKNKKVLDIGCGPGRYTVALKKMGAKTVVATDIFNTKGNWHKGIEYIRSDLQKLPFKDNEFDFIFCNGSISHNKKWKSAIREYTRVLKPDGWLWLSLFGKGNHWKYCDKIRKKLTSKDALHFEKALTLRDWETNKIFFLIDLFFIDRVYFTKDKINKFLKYCNYRKIIHLQRGVPTDLNEKVFNDQSLKKFYGEGEIRLIAKK